MLGAIVILYFFVSLPRSKTALTLDGILFFFVLAVLANVAYCAAYVVDIFVQGSGFRDIWRSYRWALLSVGLAFAGVLTRSFCITMFGATG